MIDVEDAEALVATAKSYLADRKRYAKMCERQNGDFRDRSPKQNQKIAADLGWAAMELEKKEAQLHVDCVNAGVANVRADSFYADRDLRPSNFHRYKFVVPKPRNWRPLS